MSVNGDGDASPTSSSSNPRLSIESTGASGANGTAVNGVKQQTQEEEDANEQDQDPLARLQRELDKTREEKEALASQYSTLLGKLTDMRTRLGTKLKQDAVCGPRVLISSACLPWHRKSLIDESR